MACLGLGVAGGLRVATIPFLPGITGSRVFYVRDLSMVFWGRYLWLRHELLSGSFPLWDPVRRRRAVGRGRCPPSAVPAAGIGWSA